MEEKDYRNLKKISYYKEIVKALRKEKSELIEENDYLKNRVRDLELIEKGHQEYVAELIMRNKNLEKGVKNGASQIRLHR